MADDSLILGLRYKIQDGPVKKLEGAIAKAIEKTKNLETQAGKTSATLNKMTDSYRKRQEKATKTGNSMVSTLKRMAGAALTVAGVMKGINLASDFGETSDKLGDVYGKTTSTVLKSVDEMNKKLRVSSVDLTGYYADTGAIMKGLGLSSEEAFSKSNKAIQSSIDLASFHNLSTERAMDAVRSAMLGESEALKSATGIIVLEGMMQDYAQTMGKTWKELGNTEKAMLRLDYIMKQSELQNATDNAYKTRDSFANLGKQLQGVTKDITTKTFMALTKELAPALKETYELLKNNEGVFTSLGEGIGKTVSTVTKFVGWLNKGSAGATATKIALGALASTFVTYKMVAGAAFAITKAQDLWRNAVTIPGIFKENLGIVKNASMLALQKSAQLASLAVTKTMTAAQWALNIALNANPIGLAVAGIAALAAGFTLAYKKIEPFRKAVDALWDKMKNSAVGKVVMKVIGGGEAENPTSTKTGAAPVPAFAKGTNSAPGGTALVGEKGPELVNLPSRSQVIPSKPTASIIGGSRSVTIQGDQITINLGAVQENFEDVKYKLEKFLDARERRKSQRIKTMLGGV